MMILFRDKNIQERIEEKKRVKLAAMGAPAPRLAAFDPGKLFPEYFKSSDQKMSLEEPEEIDYSDVDWKTPDQDEWMETMKLLENNSSFSTSLPRETNMAPIERGDIEFDDSIPPIEGVEGVREGKKIDRDDIEWGF